VSFTGAVSVEIQFLNFLSLVAMLRPNFLYFEPEKNNGASLINITVPVTLRYIAKIADTWMIEPYAGAAVNIPLTEKLSLPIITPLAGVQIGAKMDGIGAVFFTLEFDYDNDVTYEFGNNESHSGKRLQMFLGMGIKFGFFNRGMR
jgi:hypothetical protein